MLDVAWKPGTRFLLNVTTVSWESTVVNRKKSAVQSGRCDYVGLLNLENIRFDQANAWLAENSKGRSPRSISVIPVTELPF